MANVVGAQLYTLRNFLKTKEDMETGFKKVADMGYTAVQVSGMGPIDPTDIKLCAEKNNLKICATHVSFDRIKDDFENVVKEHKLWNCEYVGVGSMPGKYSSAGEQGFKQFAADASLQAKNLAKEGLKFIYHNHNFEFVKFEDGRTGLDILFDESDPEYFTFEIDTYWVQAGGGDPVRWIKKMKDRMDVIHYKDMIYRDGRQTMAEIGQGNLNWPEIIKATNEIGVKWTLVEQDECFRDPFESLAISLKFLKGMGF